MVMMVYSQKPPKHISRQFIESVLESFRSFSGPLLTKPVTGQELFFAVSYSKPALDMGSLDIIKCTVVSISVPDQPERI